MNNTEIFIPLIVGFVLDCLIGDPHRMPHPIKLFGSLIAFGENRLNRSERQSQSQSLFEEALPVNSLFTANLKSLNRFAKLKGALLAILLIIATFLFFLFLQKWISDYKYLYIIVSSIFVFYGLANRSLIQEALKVIQQLNKEGIEAGRQQLSMIVGRDTSKLNAHQVRTAVLETLAENLSDGIVAPLFYYAIGGIPAMLAYKMANTLDSMIGYKDKRYKDFGCFAAKLDDVLNFIPARLTAFLMVLITFSFRGARFIFTYGRKHSSPNAGYPEAALAGILNCRLGGSNVYHGILVEKPFIGINSREVTSGDVVKASVINFCVAFLFSGLIILVYI